MPLTRNEIMLRAFDNLDLSPSEVENLALDKRYRSFNDLCRDWAKATKCFSALKGGDLVASQSTYDLTVGETPLAARAFEIRKVSILTSAGSNKVDLGYKPFIDFPDQWEIDRGTPIYWSSRGLSQLILWPIPVTSITNGLFVDFYHYPLPLAETAAPDTALAISAATNATPVVVTVDLTNTGLTDHGIQTGELVQVEGVLGNTAANNGADGTWIANRISATQISLGGAAGNGTYTGGGTVQTCLKFPPHHREGLVAGMTARLCEMNKYDETLLGQMPFYLEEYAQEINAVTGREAHPGLRGQTWAGRRRMSGGNRGGRDVWRLPGNYSR